MAGESKESLRNQESRSQGMWVATRCKSWKRPTPPHEEGLEGWATVIIPIKTSSMQAVG